MHKKKTKDSQNIIKCLERVKLGTLSFSKLREFDTERRIRELNVSKFMNLKQPQDGDVTYLDTDGYNGRFMLQACNCGSIYIHDLANESGTLRHECQIVGSCSPGHADFEQSHITTAQWYPFDTGLFAVSGGNNKLKIWDGNEMCVIETIDVKRTINRHHICAVPSPSCCLIAVATTSTTVYLVDIRTGNSIQELRGHKSGVNACAFSPGDGDTLVTGSVDGQMLLWDVRMARGYLMEMPNEDKSKSDPVKGLCFASDGRTVVFASGSGKIRSWNLFQGGKTGTVVEFARVSRGYNSRLVQMDMTADASHLFIPDKYSVSIYSLRTRKLVKNLNEHYGNVLCCRFNSFASELYSGGMDEMIIPYRDETEITRGYSVDLERNESDTKFNLEVRNEFVRNKSGSLWLDSDSDSGNEH